MIRHRKFPVVSILLLMVLAASCARDSGERTPVRQATEMSLSIDGQEVRGMLAEAAFFQDGEAIPALQFEYAATGESLTTDTALAEAGEVLEQLGERALREDRGALIVNCTTEQVLEEGFLRGFMTVYLHQDGEWVIEKAGDQIAIDVREQ